MEKLNWGVLGISGHYKLRIDLPLSRYENAVKYAIASRDKQKAAEAAENLGFVKSYGSYQALLNEDNIDAVYIPLPNHMHFEWIKKAADAGKHIICEKPLCMSSAEVEEAFTYCKSKGVYLMEAFMFRFHPQWLRVKEIADVGELGKIKTIQCIFSYNNKDPENIRNQADVGGGALRDIGCYGIAVSQLIMDKEPVCVKSLIKNDKVFKTDQLTSFIIDFGDCHSLVTVSTQLFPSQRVIITGTSGSIEVTVPFNMYNDVPAEVSVKTGVGERLILTDSIDQYACEFDAFTKAVNEKDSSFFKMMEEFSKRNQLIIDAVFKAAAEN